VISGVSHTQARPAGRAPHRAPAPLLVEVSDALPTPPLPPFAHPPDDENGRGSLLVAGAARRWGIRHAGMDKTVWFEPSLPG
jgi:hypothetical protein